MPCISPPFSDIAISFSLRWLLKFHFCSMWRDYLLTFFKTVNKQCHLLLMFFSTTGYKKLKDWVNINLKKKQIIWRFYYLGIMYYIFEHFQRG